MGRLKRVLVIEDEEDSRELLVDVLTSSGYKVLSARNGDEALSSARASRPDVIVLDLVMPEMSGWEFRTAQLKDSDLAAIPVIAVSAAFGAGGEAASDLMQSGAFQGVGFLPKPVRIDELLATIRDLSGG